MRHCRGRWHEPTPETPIEHKNSESVLSLGEDLGLNQLGRRGQFKLHNPVRAGYLVVQKKWTISFAHFRVVIAGGDWKGAKPIRGVGHGQEVLPSRLCVVDIAHAGPGAKRVRFLVKECALGNWNGPTPQPGEKPWRDAETG